MNNILENRLSMYEKVQSMLSSHVAETASIPAVATLKAELDNVVGKILTSAGISNVDITGYTVQKGNKRAELSKLAIKVSTAQVAWARMNAKPQEAEKWDETPAMLDAMRDNDVCIYAQQLNIAAVANLANLSPFGVVAADTTALASRITEFLTLMQEPRVRIGDRGAELENLTRLFDTANDILKLKLDAVMAIFTVSNPTLYSSYLNARSIDDTGAVTSPDYTGTMGANNTTRVAEIPYLSSRIFIIKNTGAVPLVFGLSTNPTNIESDEVQVPAGATIQRMSATITTKGNFVLLRNDDPVQDASYEIRINE
jgi:hypothetical protein